MKKSKATKGVPPIKNAPQETVIEIPVQIASVTMVPDSKALSPEQRDELAELEKVIDAKLGDFFDVGNALTEIKNKELYRETHRNFNAYCQERWGFGRSYANKLIGSAERIRLLPDTLTKPANEFQIRPFLKLEPKAFPEKWQAILDAAGESKITAKIVKKTLNLPAKKRKKRESKAPGAKEDISLILGNLRTALKGNDVEEALKQLGRLEKVLKV